MTAPKFKPSKGLWLVAVAIMVAIAVIVASCQVPLR
jgi:hypothetical protein